VQKNGYGGAGGPAGGAERPALLLLKGKAGRTESPPAAIADALGALLAAAQLAGAASITPQVRRPARADARAARAGGCVRRRLRARLACCPASAQRGVPAQDILWRS
jgi:hypothetical protein